MVNGTYIEERILDKEVECLDGFHTMCATQVRFNTVEGGTAPGTVYSIEQDGGIVVLDEECIEALYKHVQARASK